MLIAEITSTAAKPRVTLTRKRSAGNFRTAGFFRSSVVVATRGPPLSLPTLSLRRSPRPERMPEITADVLRASKRYLDPAGCGMIRMTIGPIVARQSSNRDFAHVADRSVATARDVDRRTNGNGRDNARP